MFIMVRQKKKKENGVGYTYNFHSEIDSNFHKYLLYTLHLHFTFMHLADAFIQSDLQCIQAIHVLSLCISLLCYSSVAESVFCLTFIK